MLKKIRKVKYKVFLLVVSDCVKNRNKAKIVFGYIAKNATQLLNWALMVLVVKSCQVHRGRQIDVEQRITTFKDVWINDNFEEFRTFENDLFETY